MIKLLSSAALGLSVLVALTTAPIHATENISAFGVTVAPANATKSSLEHVMKRVNASERRERLGYNVQPHDFSMTHRIPQPSPTSGQTIYKAGQFLFQR